MLFDSILTQSNQNQQDKECDHHKYAHKVLLHGIDTLAITAGGAVAPSSWLLEQYDEWVSIQQHTQDTGDEQAVKVGNEYWILRPYGSQPYKFQLLNKQIGFIKVWNPKKWIGGATAEQQIHIHFYSEFLHSFSKPELRKEVDKLVSYFFEALDGVSIKVSRLDLHTDITHYRMFTDADASKVITRAKVRDAQYGDDDVFTEEEEEVLSLIKATVPPPSNNKGRQNFIDDKSHQELLSKITPELLYKMSSIALDVDTQGPARVVRSKQIETLYFGKKNGGDIVCSIYDKTKEVKKKNNEWVPQLWKQNGWNQEGTVIRVEFLMRRDFIKQLNNGLYVDIDGAFSGLDDIWFYLTNNWARMVEEVKENNYTRSSITPFWSVVISSYKEVESAIVRSKNYKGKAQQLIKQSLGCFIKALCLGMNNNSDTLFISANLNTFDQTIREAFMNGDFSNTRKLLGFAA